MTQYTVLPVVRSHSMTLAVLPDRLPVEALRNSMSVCLRNSGVLMRRGVIRCSGKKRTGDDKEDNRERIGVSEQESKRNREDRDKQSKRRS
jgi:hypothetical protein